MTRRTRAKRTPDPLDDSLAVASRLAAAERATVGGLYGSARALVLAHLARERPVVAVTAGLLDAEGVEDDVRTLAPKTGTLLLRPQEGDDLSAPDARADLSERLTHLRRIGHLGRRTVALVAAPVLLEPLPTRDDVSDRRLVLRVGEEVDLPRLRALLADAGYTPVPMVGAPAELSVRGDIVDLYPLGEHEPVRVELFDDAIESIRTFDLESQRSTGPREEVAIPLVTPAELRRAEARSLLFDHVDESALVVRLEPRRIRERLEEVSVALEVERPIVRRARAWLEQAPGLDLVGDTVDDGPTSGNVRTLSVQGLGGGVDELDRSLSTLRRNASRVVVFAESDGEVRRIGKVLRDQGLFDAGLTLRKGRLRTGFQLVDAGVAYLNHLELLGKPRLVRPRPRRPAIPAKAIQNLLELTPGDHVVHVTHGIARYEGTTRMKRDLGEEEFLVLAFDGGTTFYLPTSKIDLVQRYVGAGGAPPKLDRIGGKSWSNKRAKVKKALEEIAHELLEVQAAREVRVGPPHPMDDPLIDDFEASFPYEDTPDQRGAMKAIHADLGGPRPMDRLLCGDVGFGKTELAVRAAFRVVCGGRQAAVLVPTTLLAEQHVRTFQERLAPYPVRVEALSRFRTRKHQREVVEGLVEGKVDIVIGTHRLLSKDVRFKELGLVVVDEEQRFGVKAKEALKRLRRAVDVLTLTATPIPRTLHMALVGLRDISSLDTPPPGRRPVKTEIRRFDDELIRRSIRHELGRGGQVFFVHNRVAALDRLAVYLGDLVPNARIAIAPGHMPEGALEETTRR
ncbi:MAG: DEAD/DEAH box helicase, partial [Planctomycetota bacterium JB042]